jgi:hypothetical protein
MNSVDTPTDFPNIDDNLNDFSIEDHNTDSSDELVEETGEKCFVLDKSNTVVDLYNNIYKFNGSDIMLIRVEFDIYFRGNDIAKILGYTNPSKEIGRLVHFDDKLTYEKMLDTCGVPYHGTPLDSTNPNNLRTMFINQSGLFSLVFKSHLPNAI